MPAIETIIALNAKAAGRAAAHAMNDDRPQLATTIADANVGDQGAPDATQAFCSAFVNAYYDARDEG